MPSCCDVEAVPVTVEGNAMTDAHGGNEVLNPTVPLKFDPFTLICLEWSFNKQWSAVLLREENGLFGLDFFYKRRFK